MKELVSSKQFSLACAIFNGVFALYSFTTGSLGIGLICVVFCAFCASNYIKAK